MELNKIYNENCISTMAKMQDCFVDLTVTSPPYDNLRTYTGETQWNENVWKSIVKELYRVTKKGGVVVWIVNDATINGSETGTSFKQALYAKECGFNLHDTMIFTKTNPTYPGNNRYNQVFEYMFVFSKGKPKTFNPIKVQKFTKYKPKNPKTRMYSYRRKDGSITGVNDNAKERFIASSRSLEKTKGNVWEYPIGYMVNSKDKISFDHPATFPEQLANDHIITWSNVLDLVYDPFMGSGTTGKMAILNDRYYIGSEISEEYCKIAKKRIIPRKKIVPIDEAIKAFF